MCYIHSTTNNALFSFCGDNPEDLHLMVYADADFAGDIRSSKSTSGAYIALAGPNSFMPISAVCCKQSVVSHSSTESEIISLEHALRNEAIPILSLWDLVIDVMRSKRQNVPRPMSNKAKDKTKNRRDDKPGGKNGRFHRFH